MFDLDSFPQIPVPLVSAFIAALGALFAYRAYRNRAHRDVRDDSVKGENLVSTVEIILGEKAQKAQRGLSGSGVTTAEAESMSRIINEALTVAPQSAKVCSAAAAFHAATGNLAKAETYYRRAVRLAPSDPNTHLALFIHLQRVSGSSPDQHLNAALEKAANSADAFGSIGAALVIFNRLDEAESAYRSGLTIDQNISGLWYNLGSVLRRKGRHEDSYAAFLKAAAINPNDPEIFCNLGNACLRIGKYDEALRNINRAIGLDPNYALPHNSLAAVLQELGRDDEAQAAYERYLELSQTKK